MDTLCIPVHPSAKVYRKKALKLLGKTFHEADAVLILDRELEIVDPVTSTFLEIGLRILCSGWLKRLWTLQEATLASEARGADKLYFQMHGGPFLYQKYDRDRKSSQGLDKNEVRAEERYLLNDWGIMLLLGEKIPSVRAMRDMRMGWSPFEVIWAAIEHRSTSKVEDVPVCIASLLGRDTSKIVAASGTEQRMAQFYLLMREVPIGVLWADKATRLSIAPFRWAPQSITGCGRTYYQGYADGVCDEDGFHVRLAGAIFTEEETRRLGFDGMLPRVFTLASATGSYQLRSWPTPVPAMDELTSKEIPLLKSLAFLIRPWKSWSNTDFSFQPNALVVSIDKTIVPIVDTEAPEYACHIVGHLSAFPSDAWSIKPPPETVYQVRTTSKNQKWCLT